MVTGSKSKPATSKTTTGAKRTRKAATHADVKLALEKARKKVQALEKKAFAVELTALIKEKNIASAISVIKANVKGVTDTAILDAIATAAGMKRMEITQAPPKPRKAK